MTTNTLQSFEARITEAESPEYRPAINVGEDSETIDNYTAMDWAGERAIEIHRIREAIRSILWSRGARFEAGQLIARCDRAIAQIESDYPDLMLNF